MTTFPKTAHNISTFNTGETSSNYLEQKKPGLDRINDKIREMTEISQVLWIQLTNRFSGTKLNYSYTGFRYEIAIHF